MSAELGAALGIILVAGVSATVLRTLGASFLPPVVCLGAVLALSLFTDGLAATVEGVLSLTAYSNISYYLEGAIKVVGVGYLASVCRESCEALGEGLLGRTAETVGRIEIVIVSFPYFFEIFEMGVGMLS